MLQVFTPTKKIIIECRQFITRKALSMLTRLHGGVDFDTMGLENGDLEVSIYRRKPNDIWSVRRFMHNTLPKYSNKQKKKIKAHRKMFWNKKKYKPDAYV